MEKWMYNIKDAFWKSECIRKWMYNMRDIVSKSECIIKFLPSALAQATWGFQAPDTKALKRIFVDRNRFFVQNIGNC